jgi:hypothetical protein
MKGYKTIVVNGALAVLPVIDYVANNGHVVAAVIPHATAVMSVIGLINVILRWVTTTPVLKQE